MDQIEGHPIPQDITGFQFRLVGDMTVKQFAYLAGGLLLGFISFTLPLFILFRIFLTGAFVFIGVLLAFIPIEGRPSDTMLMLFLQALLKPNEFTYKNQVLANTTTVTPPPQITEKIEKKVPQKDEKVFFASNPPASVMEPEEAPEDTSSFPEDNQIVAALPIQPAQEYQPLNNQPSSQPEIQQQNTQHTAESEEYLAKELEQAKLDEQLNQGQPEETHAHEKVMELEQQLQEMQQQKEQLERQLLHLQTKLSTPHEHVFTPTTASVPEETSHVKKIPQQLQKSTGVPFAPDAPNVITGIIKDSRGNSLPNILVEVKDKDQNPVRAFKTNQLGQFISATPLLNGVYTITFEDPKKQQKFDTIEMTADGSVLSPLEVISIDAREELRKSLFATNN